MITDAILDKYLLICHEADEEYRKIVRMAKAERNRKYDEARQQLPREGTQPMIPSMPMSASELD